MQDGGVDGVLIANEFSLPYQPKADAVTVGAMGHVVGRLKEDILTPILLPVAAAIGVAPVHLGVILVLNLTIGMLTPPFGVGLYTVATVGKEAPHKVLKELVPLYIPLLIALMVVTYVPELTMWLPSLL